MRGISTACCMWPHESLEKLSTNHHDWDGSSVDEDEGDVEIVGDGSIDGVEELPEFNLGNGTLGATS